MTVLYTFIDESGNFDFSPSGTRYFVLTGFSTFDPHSLATGFYRLRHDLLSRGHEVEYFHATEDRQAVRDAVFRELSQHMFEIDAVIIEKAKTHPGLRPIERFYPRISSILLNYILQRHLWRGIDEFVIYTASVATKGKREAFTKGIKRGIVSTAGKGRRYHVLHHHAMSHVYLQAADYCGWAIYRKWEAGDRRSYELVQPWIKSEFDVFHEGTTRYY